MRIIDYIRREYEHYDSWRGRILIALIFVFGLGLLILYGYFWTFIYGLVDPGCYIITEYRKENTCGTGGFLFMLASLVGISILSSVVSFCKYCFNDTCNPYGSHTEESKLITEVNVKPENAA